MAKYRKKEEDLNFDLIDVQEAVLYDFEKQRRREKRKNSKSKKRKSKREMFLEDDD